MIEKVYKMSPADEFVIEPVIKDEHIHYMHMVLPKGKGMPVHNANANVYMTVVQGTLSISLEDGDTKVYERGTILNIPITTKMHARNEHEGILELFVVKSPAPLS